MHPLFIIVTFKLIVQYIIVFIYLVALLYLHMKYQVTVLCKYMHRVGWALVLRFFFQISMISISHLAKFSINLVSANSPSPFFFLRKEEEKNKCSDKITEKRWLICPIYSRFKIKIVLSWKYLLQYLLWQKCHFYKT